MKFTDLLKNWIDARDSYNEACRFEYDNPYLDEQHEIMIKYEHRINEIIEDLRAFERRSESDYDA
jgi:hypothetical protein